MAENKEHLHGDYSNAALTHTTDGENAPDFLLVEQDIEREPEIQRESKTSGKMLGVS